MFKPSRFLWPIGLLILLLWIGAVRSTGERPGVSAAGVPTPQPLVLRADDAGLTLEWMAPAWNIHTVTGPDGAHYSAVQAPGWEMTDAAGQPQLPLATALVVAPPDGAVSVHVELRTPRRYALPYPLLPAPRLVPYGDPPYTLVSRWTPPEPPVMTDTVTLEEAGRLRGRRLLRLTFRPLRADPTGTALESVESARVELSFVGVFQPAGAIPSGIAAVDDSPLLAALSEMVLNPAQVSGFAHVAQTPIRPQEFATPPDTEYLIIAPATLITTVAPLATYRATVNGLRVFSVTAEAIYNAYSKDVITATAIRDYISATYHSASPPMLDYVLLVGDGSDRPAVQHIPPYLIDDPWDVITEGIAADNRFVAVDGNDSLPDLAIGRLPVNTVAEAQVVIRKILTYEQSPPPWPWNARALFFAGNALSADPLQEETEFRRNADSLYWSLPVTITGQRTFFCTAGCTEPYHYTDINLAATLTRAQLNGGGLLAVYSGHSSWHQWTVVLPGGETMFHVNDISGLRNGDALPVVIEMTCLTSRFAFWESPTLDESLLRHPNGGAVATWGPTGMGSSGGHATLAGRFFYYLFKKGINELGTLTTRAKLDLFNSGRNLDLLDSFVLLGDPAMRLNLTIVPWADQVFLPLVIK